MVLLLKILAILLDGILFGIFKIIKMCKGSRIIDIFSYVPLLIVVHDVIGQHFGPVNPVIRVQVLVEPPSTHIVC